MRVEHEDLSALAYGLVQNTLPDVQKRRAQQLVMDSPEFLEALKLEVALKSEVKSLKKALPKSVELRVYGNLTVRCHQLLYKSVFQAILKATLPSITRPIFGLLERSVCANELP